MAKKKLIGLILLAISFTAHADSMDRLQNKINNLLKIYILQHKNSELLTGIAANVQSPKLNSNYYSGTISNEKNAPIVGTQTLFEIGSITKSFTSSIILQLEAEGVLNINQNIGHWLPQYPKWKDVTIKHLLNMTSGIPDYLTSDTFLKELTKNMKKHWTNEELVDLVYQSSESTKGFSYSNTNYILLGMIIEKATGHTFTEEINRRLLGAKYNLNNTFYSNGKYENTILDRLANGYYYGEVLPNIARGDDMKEANLSFAGPAGGIISNPEDISHWVNSLISGKVLPDKQMHELTEMVSTETGKTIKMATAKDTLTFALGISQQYKTRGNYWVYEGDTLGYRAIYVTSKCGDMIASVSLNSSPVSPSKKLKDDSTELAFNLYNLLLRANPGYVCKE